MLKAISDLLTPVAHKHGIAVSGFGYDEEKSISGVLNLTTADYLPASPITPTSSDSPVWSIFAGTIRSVYENTATLGGRTVIPVGDIMTGDFTCEA